MGIAEGEVESLPMRWPQRYTESLGSLTRQLLDLGGHNLDLTDFVIAGVVLLLTVAVLSNIFHRKKKNARKNFPPKIPGGLPFLGNILQLKDARPQQIFTNWALKYGPIYQYKQGSINNVVVTSVELAKEITVTKFSSISTRRPSTAVMIMTANKNLVAMADYGPQHQKLKRALIGSLLGLNSQKSYRGIREHAIGQMLDEMFATIKGQESAIINVRHLLKSYLFRVALTQVFGYYPEVVHVPELGRYVDRDEIFEALVLAPMKALTYLDWRNDFPALSFIPNSIETEIRRFEAKRTYIVDALIEEQRHRIASQGPTRHFCDVLLTETKNVTPVEVQMLIWEAISLSVDSTMATTEWALYEIARNPQIQERMYQEIKSVAGDRMVTEDDIDKLPLLTAVIQESWRLHASVPMLFPRYVSEDITIGGYDIPKGSNVVVNVYGIHLNPKTWSNPEQWDPDRLLSEKRIDVGVNDFRILTFGAGKRICPGINQTTFNTSMILTSFVLHSEFSLPPGNPNEKETLEDPEYFTVHLLHPLEVVAKPRVGSRIKYEGEIH